PGSGARHSGILHLGRRLAHRRARRGHGEERDDAVAVHRRRPRGHAAVARCLQSQWRVKSAEDLAHDARLPRDCRHAGADGCHSWLGSCGAYGTASMNATVTASSVARELAAICGAEHLTEDAESLAQFAIDETVPQVAVAPASASEVSAVVSLAAKENLVVVPGGGFTQQSIGNIPAAIDILLDTRRLNHIEHYDPGDLTIGVGAGCSLTEINKALNQHGQF